MKLSSEFLVAYLFVYHFYLILLMDRFRFAASHSLRMRSIGTRLASVVRLASS
jgi:hypothetical protein